MPAFLVITSHWLGLNPGLSAMGLRTGQPPSHAITSDLGNCPPARSRSPIRVRPTPVLDSVSRSGPAIWMPAMRSSSRIREA